MSDNLKDIGEKTFLKPTAFLLNKEIGIIVIKLFNLFMLIFLAKISKLKTDGSKEKVLIPFCAA